MRRSHLQRSSCIRLLASGVGLLAAAILAAGASAGSFQLAVGVTCPVTVAELNALVGKSMQRVNLSDDDGDPASQCAFSAVRSTPRHLVSPQVFLSVDPGGAGDLRDLYQYYVQSRGKLATRPRVTMRPDLGAGAFTLAATTTPVTTAFFLLAKGAIGTLTVDLDDAAVGRRDQATADKIFALVRSRLH
jgi:hypothetical protein